MNNVKTNFKMFLWMSLLTGVLYPLLLTGIGYLLMPHKSGGSFLTSEGKIIGSTLIGQKFESEKYFWGRPSSSGYNPLPSEGSNLGPTSALLKQQVSQREAFLLKAHGLPEGAWIPRELLFASGSGLDPHISPHTAHFQIERILKARGLDPKATRSQVEKLVKEFTYKNSYTNVLELNLALDKVLRQ
jgi:K+-transporting ATPase ATPase C chain